MTAVRVITTPSLEGKRRTFVFAEDASVIILSSAPSLPRSSILTGSGYASRVTSPRHRGRNMRSSSSVAAANPSRRESKSTLSCRG
jgi:hypothetical protein